MRKKMKYTVSGSSESEKDSETELNEIRELFCKYCKSFIPGTKALRAHIPTCTKRPQCKECKLYFKDATKLEQHIKKCEYGYIDKSVKHCEICNKSYSIHRHYLRHFKYNHDPNYKKVKYTCDMCGSEMLYCSLSDHMKRHFTGKTYNYICGYCGQAFSTKTTLVVHERKHTNERPFSCTLCEKAFRCNTTLKSHMESHKKEKTFECDICHQMYPHKLTLGEHKKRHFVENKKHKCPTCGKCFFKSTELKNHITVKHLEVHQFACELCDTTFKVKSRLDHHMVVHSGIRAHVCEICGKSYFNRNPLLRHQHLHFQLLPCLICKKKFAMQRTLQYHMRTIHNQTLSSN